MRFGDRVCVPDVAEIRKSILEEGHRSRLSIHPGATKMYHDLKNLFWWPGMKKEIVEFVYACLVCQKSKIEHHKLSGLMEPLFVPERSEEHTSELQSRGLISYAVFCL